MSHWGPLLWPIRARPSRGILGPNGLPKLVQHSSFCRGPPQALWPFTLRKTRSPSPSPAFFLLSFQLQLARTTPALDAPAHVYSSSSQHARASHFFYAPMSLRKPTQLQHASCMASLQAYKDTQSQLLVSCNSCTAPGHHLAPHFCMYLTVRGRFNTAHLQHCSPTLQLCTDNSNVTASPARNCLFATSTYTQ